MKKECVRWLIITYLRSFFLNKNFTYGDFEHIKQWAWRMYHIQHNTDYYLREFRKMVESDQISEHFRFTKKYRKVNSNKIAIMRVNKLR